MPPKGPQGWSGAPGKDRPPTLRPKIGQVLVEGHISPRQTIIKSKCLPGEPIG